MMEVQKMKQAGEAVAIGAVYIAVSASLITFNKFLMDKDRFPHAGALTTIHMAVTSLMSFLLYKLWPGLYPSMNKAKENWQLLLKYLVPLGTLFALALYCSNKAYLYCTVAFLQFCKEGNAALVFFMACALGMQSFSWTKVSILSVVIFGCSLCAHGEVNFALLGFLLQITSQIAECCKNIMGELILSGAGLKLDVLTFVFFQAPCSLVPLSINLAAGWRAEIMDAFLANYHLLLLNALNAFALNLMIATTLKRLSAVAFVLIGLAKDSVIVAASSVIFGDPISMQQKVGFAIIMLGCSLWGYVKIEESRQQDKLEETKPLNPSKV